MLAMASTASTNAGWTQVTPSMTTEGRGGLRTTRVRRQSGRFSWDPRLPPKTGHTCCLADESCTGWMPVGRWWRAAVIVRRMSGEDVRGRASFVAFERGRRCPPLSVVVFCPRLVTLTRLMMSAVYKLDEINRRLLLATYYISRSSAVGY